MKCLGSEHEARANLVLAACALPKGVIRMFLFILLCRTLGMLIIAITWLVKSMALFVFYTLQAIVLIPVRIVRLIVRGRRARK